MYIRLSVLSNIVDIRLMMLSRTDWVVLISLSRSVLVAVVSIIVLGRCLVSTSENGDVPVDRCI